MIYPVNRCKTCGRIFADIGLVHHLARRCSPACNAQFAVLQEFSKLSREERDQKAKAHVRASFRRDLKTEGRNAAASPGATPSR